MRTRLTVKITNLAGSSSQVLHRDKWNEELFNTYNGFIQLSQDACVESSLQIRRKRAVIRTIYVIRSSYGLPFRKAQMHTAVATGVELRLRPTTPPYVQINISRPKKISILRLIRALDP